jgi:putative hydrolase of the HAD superfamily
MRKTSRPFTHVDTWVFDLDNTLYPHHVNLWQQVDARIGEFVSAWLKIPPDQARRIQKDYYLRYGTTMRGMMTEHGVRADDYLAYVHQIDHSPLRPNPAMGAAIARLPGRKLILTNGSSDHADKVLQRLGIGPHFEAVFDIIAAGLEPKPAPRTYQKFLRLHDVDPLTSAMFEDLARNLVVPHKLGMTTVLVVCRSRHRRPDRVSGGDRAGLRRARATISTVIPRESGVASNLGSFVYHQHGGMLDHPLSRVTTVGSKP